ncbi:helix-hairpin-helix domain-containing protein [Chitinispirillales bacterium ANBcel5]|uniref:ComEA family DNA-binding protein n=1 Tax=Cellulosispirillum alkaliphilum TaxID=3039283 RepID=UPI002A4F77DC|nr:helix-hairpin-helix domain-containing protein [Chitinispirillales bacterium ANBcel5]
MGEEKDRQRVKNLVNLNKANKEKLSRIAGMGKIHAMELIRYREKHGGFKKLDEIDSISGFDTILAEKVKKNLYIG